MSLKMRTFIEATSLCIFLIRCARRKNFGHAADVEAVGLPAFFDKITGRIENDAIGEGRRLVLFRMLARDETRFVEVDGVQRAFGDAVDDGETREAEVELDFRKLEGFGDVRIGR